MFSTFTRDSHMTAHTDNRPLHSHNSSILYTFVRIVVPVRLFAAFIVGVTPLFFGCNPPNNRLLAIATLASTNVVGAETQLNEDLDSGRVSVDEILTVAHELLDQGDSRGHAFGAAVLEVIESRQSRLNRGGEFEIFWRRVGRLAFKSAAAAFEGERFEEAARLVFAGTTRWQTDMYWLKYPDHDALASYCLARTGRWAEGVHRLRDRPSLEGDAAEALRILTNRGQ